MEYWKDWFTQQQGESTMNVEIIPVRDAEPWGLQEDGLRFGRPDGGFFNLVGLHVKVPKPGQREVPQWKQVILQETSVGAVVLIKAREQPLYLLATKAEPGNTTLPGHVTLVAPLQASRSNLEQAHGGDRPPRAELMGDKPQLVDGPRDGGRFIGKVNGYAMVEVEKDTIVLRPNERWFTPHELLEAWHAGVLNEHLVHVLCAYLLEGYIQHRNRELHITG
ncbi:NDP-hexose 2,3-dehydratase family protein [Patescibacteria group bacterium]